MPFLQGFCLPAEYSDELSQEGATEFEDIEGGGLGEGEGAKDVSSQIENEDQLEDTHKQGEERLEGEDQGEQPDIKAEDDAVEMSDDFGGKAHDLEQEGNVSLNLVKKFKKHILILEFYLFLLLKMYL